MTRRIEHTLSYDATVAEVAAMLADPAFRERVCEALGVLRHDVEIVGSGAGMQVRVERVQATEGVPSFATKFIGDEIGYVQSETWPTATHGDVVVAIPGKPGEMSGIIDLAETVGGTTETVRMDVTVSIPLVGGKLETMVGDLLLAALKVENRVGQEWLAG